MLDEGQPLLDWGNVLDKGGGGGTGGTSGRLPFQRGNIAEATSEMSWAGAPTYCCTDATSERRDGPSGPREHRLQTKANTGHLLLH